MISEKKDILQNRNYERQAELMKTRVSQMIFEKQKATIAIGIVLAQNSQLINDIKDKTLNDQHYKTLIKVLKENTEYKNIWINIVDAQLNSVYRSWTKTMGDSLVNVRPDLKEVIKTKKISHTISSGKFTFAIKALIPILDQDRVIGVVEIISHFNSISKNMEKLETESVVVLNKEYGKKLQYPFTENFLDGYYIANFQAPKEKLEYLQKNGIENYLNDGFKIENGYIIVGYALKGFQGDLLGYYIMFKKLSDISSTYEDFFIFKWLAVGFITLLIIAGIVNSVLVYIISKQKNYVKNIIDSSTNIVIINDKTDIIDVNQTFFKYFMYEKSIENFSKHYTCVCDLFADAEGYISKNMDGEIWVDYILNRPNEIHKVKIVYHEKTYYFHIGISMILPEKGYYGIVLSDVTNEEQYKLELETMTVTDALTHIGNRRFYKIKIDENIALAKRYKVPLSIIMIDIDFFKKVNDTYGHSVGDNVLVEYTKLISNEIREADVFCRMGGEEFVIILPYIDIQDALKIAEKLRKSVEEHKVILPITMSFGVTEYIHGEEEEFLLSRADQALYAAKANGRNQVVAK